ncbi:hypothetical protein BC332_15263 [Capsicum chinense]|nr:hypothetical protein BC332_15263 [Capsicum chinense]
MKAPFSLFSSTSAELRAKGVWLHGLHSHSQSSARNVRSVCKTVPLSNDPYLPPSYFSSRKSKGVPRINYELDLKANSKYPISNYTSAKRLTISYALAIDQLSKVSIPNGVQEALPES